MHDQVAQICEDFGATFLRDYEGTSLDTLRLMVGTGIGLAFLPALYVRSEIGTRGEIITLNLEKPNLYRQIGLVWRKQAPQAAFFGEMADMIRALARAKLPELSVLD